MVRPERDSRTEQMTAATRTEHGVHEAVLHTSPDELATLLAPRLGAALDAGERVVAVLDDARREALATELGARAQDVEWTAPADVHGVPAFTVAARWARLARSAGPVTVVAQHVEDLPGAGPEHWARLDLALEVAMPGIPLTVLCPCPPDGAGLRRVVTTHRRLVSPAGSRASADYRSPHEAVVEYPPPPPPDLGPPDAELAFDVPGLARMRTVAADACVRAGLAGERLGDLVLAVTEVASNSVEHGPGTGVLRTWATSAGVVLEVTDTGRTDIAFPGLTAPPPEGARGRGLWLASELADVLQVWNDDDGTVVRLHAAR
jgi:anti-sigma regulatory factor (Ser/Thr protein kinase)